METPKQGSAPGPITYSLPDFADRFALNYQFAKMMAENPELLREGVAIDSVYGCFPNCPLNGGRTFVGTPYAPAEMEATFEAFAALGLPLRLTLTNMLATPQHLELPAVDALLRLGAKYGADAIVYADFVADYVRENFGLTCTLSTTREITDVEEFNRMAQRYDCVVVNYNCHKDARFMGTIARPDRAEVMVNEYCAPHCPQRQLHYRHNSEGQLSNQLAPYSCQANKINVFLRHAPGDPVFFTCEEVEQLHRETGVSRFKIVGRGIPFDVVLESYCYYLVKPQHRREVRKALRAAWK